MRDWITYAQLKPAADVTFMALVMWREARGESTLAKLAVGHCIKNRVEHTKWWGESVMAVCFKKWQFSSMTDPNDVQLVTWPEEDDETWQECMRLAYGIHKNMYDHPAPGADSYFDDSIAPPYWADEKKFVAQIGAFRFYDLDEDYQRVLPKD